MQELGRLRSLGLHSDQASKGWICARREMVEILGTQKKSGMCLSLCHAQPRLHRTAKS